MPLLHTIAVIRRFLAASRSSDWLVLALFIAVVALLGEGW
jgi:hypothetical protein